jgi:cytochrome c oxidase subunit 3
MIEAALPSPVLPALERRRRQTSLLGMVMFMGAWVMLFAGLFFAYGVLRVRATAWPPAEVPRLPRALPAVATLLLALSSAALGRRERRSVALAALGGVGFLALQALVWRQLILAGMRPPLGPYASVFFGLTAVHALHVVVGVGALAWLAIRWQPGAEPPFALRLWGLYWHMVGALWAVMFVLVYLL